MIDDEVIWQDEAWSEYTEWILERKISIIEKILKLIKDISRNGLLKGIGKPERLKYFKDRAIYSRRITDEHRLVYDMKEILKLDKKESLFLSHFDPETVKFLVNHKI